MTALVALAVAAAIVGTPGDDTLRGTKRADVIQGREGDDVLRGKRGRDHLIGGRGYDLISGGPGADLIDARRGDEDRVDCGPGNDTVVVDVTEDGVYDCETVRFPG